MIAGGDAVSFRLNEGIIGLRYNALYMVCRGFQHKIKSPDGKNHPGFFCSGEGAT